jgi:hypothetical protein
MASTRKMERSDDRTRPAPRVTQGHGVLGGVGSDPSSDRQVCDGPLRPPARPWLPDSGRGLRHHADAGSGHKQLPQRGGQRTGSRHTAGWALEPSSPGFTQRTPTARNCYRCSRLVCLPPRQLHPFSSGRRRAQLSRPLTRPGPLGVIAPPLSHVSRDVPPTFAVSDHERDGAHASGQPTERSWSSRLHLFLTSKDEPCQPLSPAAPPHRAAASLCDARHVSV